MTRARLPAQSVVAIHALPPNRIWCEGAATPVFIVHGHRHACLYRGISVANNPFIVLKICKKLRLRLASAFAYLWNDEARVGVSHA